MDSLELEKRTKDIEVLHIDDEGQFLDILNRHIGLTDKDIQITSTEEPKRAVELIEKHDIDCVVCDYQMPSKDGVEVLKSVRDIHPDIPFMMLTGHGSKKVVVLAFSEGASDYFRKDNLEQDSVAIANRIEDAVEKENLIDQLEYELKDVKDAMEELKD